MSAPSRVALVTGGASGIGRATVRAFADAGAAVVVADVDARAGAETVSDVTAAGGDAVLVPTDVTDDAQVAALIDDTLARFGRLDWALNNAGTTGASGPTAEVDVADWNRTLALNLTSVFLCLRHEIPAMVAGGGGAIVNMASGAGLRGFPGLPAYVASKHGVVGLTRASALEYGGQGVRINAVCPGSTRTPMLEGYIGGDPKIERMMTRSVPLGRLGEPDEIAAAVVWLCSPAASFVNGHALAADGGATA